MMDLRYHFISLTAVFLALTVGIVVGSSLGSSERQTAVVQRLQQDFERVRTEDRRIQGENQVLRRRLEAREQDVRQLLPAFLQNRALGIRLAVVVCGSGLPVDALETLRRSLQLAGAEVTSTTRLPDRLGPIPASLRPVPEVEGANSAPEAEDRAAARAVARAILSGDTGGRLAELARAAGITLDGAYSAPVRRVLVIAAPPAPVPGEPNPAPDAPAAQRLAEAILDAAQEFDTKVFAATPEMPDAARFARAAADHRLPVLERIDTAAGHVALVQALQAARSAFGPAGLSSTPR